ncbi:Spy/CpxP family protein refolding chaperone [Hydrogenophaga sp.]|uniref:Spy/CpxP family protein refolding chaperone n=1 Tax=Hydrogenophaga sp. TaxID=1904254 RepID=UPI003D0B76EE
MTHFPKRALLAAALATAFVGATATAIAQGVATPAAEPQAQVTPRAGEPGAQQHAQKRAERMARMQQKRAERQAALKAELKITPAQEPAWNAFVARTQPQPRAQHPGQREDWSQLTTPERLDRMKARQAERSAAMDQRADAIRSFYAALDAEQQKVFDSKHLPGFQRTGMQRQHGGKHHHFHRQGSHDGMKQPV